MRELMAQATAAGPSRSGIEAVSQLWPLVLDSTPDKQPPPLAQVLFGRVTSWRVQEGYAAQVALMRGAPNLEVILMEREDPRDEIERLKQLMLTLQPLLKGRSAVVRGHRVQVCFDEGSWFLVLRGDYKQMCRAADVFRRTSGLPWGPLSDTD